MKPLVLFSLTNGWGIRNFVQTGLIDQVAEFADIAVATSANQFPFYQKLLESGQISFLFLVPEDESPFWRIVRRAKKGILQAKHQISTAKIKSAVNSKSEFEKFIKNIGWHFAGTLAGSWQIELIQAFERKFKVTQLPKLSRMPKVYVNCEPFDNRDNQLQRTMQRHGVPSISIIPSWDNPSTKGCILSDANSILVWGPHQKEEIMKFYPRVRSEDIKISGIPQFDSYYGDLPEALSRHKFLSSLGISPDKKVILYATCSERLFPTEYKIVAEIVEAMKDGRIASDAHLLIRCHPADRASRYSSICENDNVTLFPSSNEGRNLSEWIPSESELNILSATLRYSSVCINTASTMILDSFACGKPVIGTGYADVQTSYLSSPLRYYDYFHLQPIAASGAVPIVKSSSEMINEINKALENPQIYLEQRSSVVSSFCPRPKDGSISFIVNEIRQYC